MRRTTTLVITLALTLLAVACSPKPVATTTPAPLDSAPADTTYPLTLDTPSGPVTISARPKAIISLSASATDMLFAIGAGNQVVAVDKYSVYPADAPTTNLSGFSPNIESIASYHPDLVVADNDPGGMVRSLNSLEIPVLISQPPLTC